MAETFGAEELAQLWQTALKQYEKRTGDDLQNAPKLTPEQMVAELNEEFSGGDSRSDVVKKSLERMIELGTEIAGDAASRVFPGAGALFKAAKPMIDIAHNYRKYYTVGGVHETMNKVLPHFVRMQRYVEIARQGPRLDRAHAEIIHKILVHFLRICGIYHDLHQSSNRRLGQFKNFCKAFVSLDGGIEKEVDEIKALVEHEGQENSAGTYGLLLVDDNRRTQERNSKLIRDALKIEQHKEFEDFCAVRHNQLRRAYARGVGSWLPALDEFSAWADVHQRPAPVLVLEAESKCGKTHLCSEVVRILQDEHQSGKGTGASVAFFYLKNSDNSRGSNVKEKQPSQGTPGNRPIADRNDGSKIGIRHALLSMIWQLTSADEDYQRFVAASVERCRSRLIDSKNIWGSLIKEYATLASKKSRKVFFFVIDGLDDSTLRNEEEDFTTIIQEIMEMPRSAFQIRLLITGTKHILEKDLKIEQNSSATIIQTVNHRSSDLEAFVKFKMDSMLQYREEGEKVDLLSKIEAKFCENVQDPPKSYLDILPALDEVKEANVQELRDILYRGPEDEYSAVQWQLMRLERQLNPDEIEEFNDVLSCMVLMRVWPRVKQLSTFVWLNNKAKPQVVLEQRIRDKYLQYFKVSDDVVVSEDTERYFHQRPPLEPEVSFGDDSASQNKSHEREIAFFIRLARAWGESGVSAKLENILKAAPPLTPRIDLDITEGHIKILLRILRAVCTPNRRFADQLHSYAPSFLFHHLREVKPEQLSNTPTHLRKEIGYLLYKFFMDKDSVETWVREAMFKVPTNCLVVLFDPKEGSHGCLQAAARLQKDKYVRQGIILAKKKEGQDEHCTTAGIGQPECTNKTSETAASPALGQAGESQLEMTQDGQEGEFFDCSEPSVGSEKIRKTGETNIELERMEESREAIPGPDPTDRIPVGSDSTYQTSKEAEEDFKIYQDNISKEEITKLEGESCEALKYPGGTESLKASGHVRVAETALQIQELPLERDNEAGISKPSDKQEHLDTTQKMYELILGRCKRALDLDDKNWRAHWYKARAEILRKDRTSEQEGENGQLNEHPALAPLEAALDKLVEIGSWFKFKEERNEILDELLELSDKQKVPERGVKALAKLAETFPDDVELTRKGFDWAQGREDRHCMRNLLQALAMTVGKGKLSAMTRLLHRFATSLEFHDNLWLALHDDPGLIIKCYTDALKATDRVTTAAKDHLQFYYGLVLYYQQNVHNAVRVWEGIKLERAHFKEYPELRQLQAQISEKLASCFIQLTRSAIAMSSKSKKETEYMRKVKALIEEGDDGGTNVTNTRYLTLSLCRIYAMHDQQENAKRRIRNYLKEAKSLLQNKTYDDDCEGYMALADILLALGDEKNAKRAWSMINNADDGHTFVRPLPCDGGCGHKWESYPDAEIYICKDCPGVHLDKFCSDKLKDGKLVQRVCGKNHELFRLPAWDGEARKKMKSDVARAGDLNKLTDELLSDVMNEHEVKTTTIRKGERVWMILSNAAENLKKALNEEATDLENARKEKAVKKSSDKKSGAYKKKDDDRKDSRKTNKVKRGGRNKGGGKRS
ncbi:hypothetical protein B0J12DRAFT_756825 [Macrophomina phaseolina]|uniref:Fungal STAND N-terminal Goodbye domain-containing protein n=1 Tax=Macrophomina phaseolina TaxID=35725 RepID=A0ABQ8G791_9PEZI|nr:hypothetical protein B0J12DRAFT_756825 [Macrophomina phaseolina]